MELRSLRLALSIASIAALALAACGGGDEEAAALPTQAPTQTAVATSTPGPTATRAPVPPATIVPAPLPTATPTSVPTRVPTPRPSSTPTAIPTVIPTVVAAPTSTPIPTSTPVPPPTATPTVAPTATPIPTPPGPDDHGNSPSTATELSVGNLAGGGIEYPGDVDWFQFLAGPGTTYTFSTILENLADSKITIWATDGTTVLATNDDFGGTQASQIEWTPPDANRFYVTVESADGTSTGTYIIRYTAN
ncbi:MAG: hypothetical protein IIC27_03270 [Chloroflexi bacterium]|nr:hypothetical protein [Chloroflexota bacterium]